MIKAIICDTPGTITATQRPMPKPVDGEALLKIRRVGICGTDLHAYAGNQAFFTYPRILGHELAAEIVAIHGPHDTLQSGQEVVIIPYKHCGKCVACRQGKTNCCTSLDVIGVHSDGGMQEYIKYPIDLLLPASGLTIDEMALVEPLSVGTHAVKRADIKPGEWVAVSGCGPIGVGIIWASVLAGARVLALDVRQERLDFCAEHFELAGTLIAGKNTREEIADITGGDLTQATFDATGLKPVMEAGVQYVGAGGRYILVGLYNGELNFHQPSLHAREISLLSSRNATRQDFELVISRLQQRTFPSEAYITHKVAAPEMLTSFESWTKPDAQVMKAMTVW